MGHYLCNTLKEALGSTASGPSGTRRDSDVVVLVEGTSGPVIANELPDRDPTRSRRILALEEGPFVLPEQVQNLPFMEGTPPAGAMDKSLHAQVCGPGVCRRWTLSFLRRLVARPSEC